MKTGSDYTTGLDSFVQHAFEDQTYDDSIHLANLQFSSSFLANPYPDVTNKLWIRTSMAPQDPLHAPAAYTAHSATLRDEEHDDDIDADGSTEGDMDEDRDYSPISPATAFNPSNSNAAYRFSSPLTAWAHDFDPNYDFAARDRSSSLDSSTGTDPSTPPQTNAFLPDTRPYHGRVGISSFAPASPSPPPGRSLSPSADFSDDEDSPSPSSEVRNRPYRRSLRNQRTSRTTTTSRRRSDSTQVFVCECHHNTYNRKGDLDRHLRESTNPEKCYGGCGLAFKRKDPRIRHWDREAACEVRHHVFLTLQGGGCDKERARWYRRMMNLKEGRGVKKGWDGVAMAEEREILLEQAIMNHEQNSGNFGGSIGELRLTEGGLPLRRMRSRSAR
ncbi:hypothetical protein FRB97_003872 [Tulasnella sp. 331]|nr:hypothetical protein FRB97_003872 [Tulasnella sp. 331]KAG8889557.1 hypothetical protein FRB98_003826 [Tulasnella sp. 332]